MKKEIDSYEDAAKGSKKVYDGAEVPTDRVPYQNEYEKNLPGSDGFNQSGLVK